jgi:hypothetical protein
MNLEQLSKQLNQYPPVEQWDPPLCGDIDIEIKKDGVWWYMGSPINRMPLIKLFASVLSWRDNDFFLITPVEKIRIKVAQTPFIVTQWRLSEPEELIIFTTNVGDEFVLSPQHPLQHDHAAQEAPYLTVHRGLQASLHRNVYYQLAEMAQQQNLNGTEHWMIKSGGNVFSLGEA